MIALILILKYLLSSGVMVDQFFETPDGIGKLTSTEVKYGCTYAHVIGNGFEGWYPLFSISALEDHSEKLLAELPAQGVELPWDKSPRYRDFDTTTIEPIHELPENLDESSNSVDEIKNYADPMEPFPGDPHKYNTPYHTALRSISDLVNPESNNDNKHSIISPRDEDRHDYHHPGDSMFDHNFVGVGSNPTTPEWGTPAVQVFDRSSDFQPIRDSKARHFASSDDANKNRIFIQDYNTPFEAQIDDSFFKDPGDFDFSIQKGADLSEITDQHWSDLSQGDLDHPFERDNERFERKHTPDGGTSAEVAPKESSFDFLSINRVAYIEEENGKYHVKSHDGKNLGTYDSHEQAAKRLRQIEYFKHHDSSLNKNSDVKETDQGFFVTLPGGQKSGPYPTEAAAEEAEIELRNKYEEDKGREEQEEKEENSPGAEKEAGVTQTEEGFFATGPGGQKEGPFPTRPAAETAETAMKGAEGYREYAKKIKQSPVTTSNPYKNIKEHTPINKEDWSVVKSPSESTLVHNPYAKEFYPISPSVSHPHYDYTNPDQKFPDQNARRPQKLHNIPSPKLQWPQEDRDKWPSFDRDRPQWPHEDKDLWPQEDRDLWPTIDRDTGKKSKFESKLNEYISYLESNDLAREAAWADVREKALRLRREGAVKVLSFNPFEIITKVKGDSGIYQTQVNRKNAWGQGITWYDCTCPWGQWAYKRERSYVGRLCSHALASYYEMQSLHQNKSRQPLEMSSFSYFDGPTYDVGDIVEINQYISAHGVIPGDTGVITGFSGYDSAQVRLDHAGSYDADISVPLDCLDKQSSFYTSSDIETNDDSQDNVMDAGAFSDELPDLIQGYESEADLTKDNPTSITSSWDEDPDSEHDSSLEIYSEDNQIPEKDRLRTLTNIHESDVYDDDEQDNASLTPQPGSSDMNNTVADSGQIISRHKDSSLDWLMEDDSQSITKNSAKNYSIREQFSLVHEPGTAEEVDFLNLKDSFYEMNL